MGIFQQLGLAPVISVFAEPPTDVYFIPHQVRVQRWVLIYNVVGNSKQIVFQGTRQCFLSAETDSNRPEIFMPAAV
jgi:hypothetical protein